MPAEPYTAEQVKKIAKELQEQPGFADRDREMRDRRNLRYRRKHVNHPRIKESLEVLSPIINRDIQRYVRRMDAARMTLDVTAKVTGEEEKANKIKQYCRRSYVDIDRGVLFTPSLRYGDRQAGDGVGWGRLRLDPRFVEERLRFTKSGTLEGFSGEKGIIGIPFILETPDPIAVYYRPDRSEVAEVGYLSEGGVRPLGDTTGETEARGAWAKVWQVIRLEAEKFVYDLTFKGSVDQARDELFIVQENIFGKAGYVPFGGLVTGSAMPLEAFQPLVVDLYPLVEQKNLLDTMQNNAADLTGAPMVYLRKGATGLRAEDYMLVTAPQAERPEFKMDTGTGVMEVPEGYEPVAFSVSAGIDLLRAKEMNAADMADVGFPTILGAPQDVSARSGYDRARMEESVGYELSVPLGNRARAWRELFILQAEALKKLDVKVTIRAVHQDGERNFFDPAVARGPGEEVTIEPDDFVDIDLEVGFSSETAASRIARSEEGIRLVEAGVKSETEFLEEDRRVEDVERAKRLRDRDQLRTRARVVVIEDGIPELLAGVMETALAERRGRRKRPRPPTGAAEPGLGATLAQPATPRATAEPALGELEGEA